MRSSTLIPCFSWFKAELFPKTELFPEAFPNERKKAAEAMRSGLDALEYRLIRRHDTSCELSWATDTQFLKKHFTDPDFDELWKGVQTVTHVGCGGPWVCTNDPDVTSTNKTRPNMGPGTLYMHDPGNNKIYFTTDDVGLHLTGSGSEGRMTVCQPSRAVSRRVASLGPGTVDESAPWPYSITTFRRSKTPASLKRKR